MIVRLEMTIATTLYSRFDPCTRRYVPTVSRNFCRRGHDSLQYIKNKLTPWGVKAWCIADQSRYLLDFNIYTGKGANPVSPLGQGYDVVMGLSSRNFNKNHHVFYDNFFTSIVQVRTYFIFAFQVLSFSTCTSSALFFCHQGILFFATYKYDFKRTAASTRRKQ